MDAELWQRKLGGLIVWARVRGWDCCRYEPRERWHVLITSGASASSAFGDGGRSLRPVAPNDSIGMNVVDVFSVDGVKMRGPLL